MLEQGLTGEGEGHPPGGTFQEVGADSRFQVGQALGGDPRPQGARLSAAPRADTLPLKESGATMMRMAIILEAQSD
jgi:hypothetical protein